MEAALTQGADVLVLDPVDAASAAASVQKARSAGRAGAQLRPPDPRRRDVAVYVSFDNVRVGELQAESLSKKLKEDGSPKGPIVKINGDPADSNAALFKEGSNKGFEAAGVEIAKEYDTPGWLASNAQNEMQQAITALGKDGFAGVYAANDDTGGGAIAAMKGGRHRPGRTSDHRPGRHGRWPAADPRRPAVHDGLQGLQAGGRDQRRNRRRPGGRQRSPAGQNHR